MDADPTRAHQPEVQTGAIQDLWKAAGSLVGSESRFPIVGQVRTFGSFLDGLPVDITVMIHPDMPADDGVIGSVSVCPDHGLPEKDTTHYQFTQASEAGGVELKKLLPVDFSHVGFTEPMPSDRDRYAAWKDRYEAAKLVYERQVRAEHAFFGLDVVYENEAQELTAALRAGKAWFDSQEAQEAQAARAAEAVRAAEPAPSKGSFLAALVRKWLRRG